MEKWSVTLSTVVLSLVTSVCVVLVPTSPTCADTLVVTTTYDELNSDGDCSLREAIEAANTDSSVDACGSGSGDDTITFDLPAGSTMTLGGSHLTITTTITMTGPGAEQFAISGNNSSRVFFIDGSPDMVVTISNVTIREGNAGDERGGGLYNRHSRVILDGVTIRNNQTNERGGGIGNLYGTLTLRDCLVSDNTASFGGGIYHYTLDSSAPSLEILRSTIRDNQADGGNGGGLYTSRSMVTMSDSTVSGNHTTGTKYGGGLITYKGIVTLENCTISGNVSARSPGIRNQYGVLRLTHCTVTENIGTDGYGGTAVKTVQQGGEGTLHLI